jgi:BolA family transcriptional regulator, general stress-responsive regulator
MTARDAAAVTAAIRQRLAALDPDVLELHDESAEHAGHAGARAGGGHYRLLIVSRRFLGQGAVARHRLVYQALQDLMPQQIHALAITAYTPEELDAAFPAR